MLKTLLSTSIAVALLGVPAAYAATITFETDEAGFISVGSTGGTQTGGAPQGPFAAFGTTFTVDADTFVVTSPTTISLNGETDIEITQNNEGLGIDNNNGWYGADNSNVDGSFGNDILFFSFTRDILLETVIFENVSNNDDFVFYVPGATPEAAQFDIVNPLAVPDTDGDEGMFDFGGRVVSSFGLGALGGNDNFRVSKMEATAVPLPAAGWLMLAGLGGIAALRRRKKA